MGEWKLGQAGHHVPVTQLIRSEVGICLYDPQTQGPKPWPLHHGASWNNDPARHFHQNSTGFAKTFGPIGQKLIPFERRENRFKEKEMTCQSQKEPEPAQNLDLR